MPLTMTNITGPVYLPNGATPLGGRVSFELSSWDVEDTAGLVVTGPVYVPIDENGQFNVQLFTTTAGTESVTYRMFVIWEDSVLTQSYVNDIYVSQPTPHYTKKFIGSFVLSGPGPYQLSELDIVSEVSNSSFDAYLEMKAFADRIDLGALDQAVAVTTENSDIATTQAGISTEKAEEANTSAVQAGVYRDQSEVARDNVAALVAAVAQYFAFTRDDVSALLDDTSLTYNAGQPGTVTAGDYVRTRAEGFSYEVAAPDATDHHIATADGVKLYDLQGRNAIAAARYAAGHDGDVVVMGGLSYQVDSTATGTASATNDLGVDGIKPWPGQPATPQHYGANGTAAKDGAAFSALFSNNLSVEIPWISGGYNLGAQSAISIREMHRVFCHGAVIKHSSDANHMFEANGVKNWSWTGVTFPEGLLTTAVDYHYDGEITTGGSDTVLTDTSFTSIGDGSAATVYVTSGPNAGESRAVSSTSGNTITVSSAFTSNFTVGDKYKLLPDEAFIKVVNCARYKIEGVAASAFKGAAFRIEGDSALTSDRGEQGQMIGLAAYECSEGLWVRSGAGTEGAGAEYNIFTNFNASGCVLGMDVGAGNQVFTGGNLVDNTNGVFIRDGYNNAHGIISAMNINHNTRYNVHARDVTNGQSFADCHFYANNSSGAGALFFDNCKGIDINGGVLDAWVYNYAGSTSGYNYVRNMFCPGDYGTINYQDATSTDPEELIREGLYGAGSGVFEMERTAGMSRCRVNYLTTSSVRVEGIPDKLIMGGFRFQGQYAKSKGRAVPSGLGNNLYKAVSETADLAVESTIHAHNWYAVFAVSNKDDAEVSYKLMPFFRAGTVSGNDVPLAQGGETDGDTVTATTYAGLADDELIGADVLVIQEAKAFHGRLTKVTNNTSGQVTLADAGSMAANDFFLVAPPGWDDYVYLGSYYHDSAEPRNMADTGRNVGSYGVNVTGLAGSGAIASAGRITFAGMVPPLATAALCRLQYSLSTASTGKVAHYFWHDSSNHEFEQEYEEKTSSSTITKVTQAFEATFSKEQALWISTAGGLATAISSRTLRVLGWVEP